VNAESCANWPENIGLVSRQIETYLEVHQLRRRLKAATEGLEPIKNELERKANKFWQWPWRRPNKQAAVKDFAERLRELTEYLANLENHDLPSRPYGTGVAVGPLDQIKSELDDIYRHIRESSSQEVPEAKKNILRELVQEARTDRSKAGLEPITGKINRTIEELRLAFAA
jgi:hypothetical protein